MENQTPLHLEDKLPNRQLTLYTPQNDEIITKMIDEYEGKRLVLFFYPADFTFVCPTELKDINKIYKDIQDSNADLLVISTDTVFSHKRRIETEKLLENFSINMVSDRTGEISELFGILNKST